MSNNLVSKKNKIDLVYKCELNIKLLLNLTSWS